MVAVASSTVGDQTYPLKGRSKIHLVGEKKGTVDKERSTNVCARLMSLFRTSSPETVLKTRSYVGKAEFGPESQSRTPWLEVGS